MARRHEGERTLFLRNVDLGSRCSTEIKFTFPQRYIRLTGVARTYRKGAGRRRSRSDAVTKEYTAEAKGGRFKFGTSASRQQLTQATKLPSGSWTGITNRGSERFRRRSSKASQLDGRSCKTHLNLRQVLPFLTCGSNYS